MSKKKTSKNAQNIVSQPESSRQVDENVRFSGAPDDGLLIVHIIDTKSDHEYKIYATGEMTGFPDGCLHLNKFLPLLIRILNDRLPKERLKQLGLGN